ncbi:MAG: DNA-3-methyladenine glycosylase [Rhodospirillaceae bacterium]|jgi:DNA-3-methyladenine glycosylase II|nr:DNA-3-methyladenine glycosylase [Rhodospirillaceae bacterium]
MTLVQSAPAGKRQANKPIEGRGLAAALAALARQDSDLARAIAEVGAPPPRARPAGFASLLDIVLAQQVSTASFRAIAARLTARIGLVTPASILALGEAELRAIGFSRQKAIYARGLAEAAGEGRLDLETIATLPDEAAIAELVRMKGIGRWSAEIYLMFCCGRPDVLPAGDLALREAAGLVKGSAQRPDEAELRRMGEAWQPWRSVAARLLWHYYAHRARRAVAPLPLDSAATPRSQ